MKHVPSLSRTGVLLASGDVNSARNLTAEGNIDVRNPGGKDVGHREGRFHTSYENGNTHASVDGYDGEVSYDMKTHGREGEDIARLLKTPEGGVSLVNAAGHGMRLDAAGGMMMMKRDGGNGGQGLCIGGKCLGADHIRDIKRISKSYVRPSAQEAAMRRLLRSEAEARKAQAAEVRGELEDAVTNTAEYAIFLEPGKDSEHAFYRDGKVYVLAMGGGASGQSRENYMGGGAGYIISFQTPVKRGDVMRMRVGRGGKQIPYGFGGKSHAAGEDTEVRIGSLTANAKVAKGASGPDGSSGGGKSAEGNRTAYDGGEKGSDGGRMFAGSSYDPKDSGKGMGNDAFESALAPLSSFNPYGIRVGSKGIAETVGYYRCGGGGGGIAVDGFAYESAQKHPSRGDAGAAKPGEGLGAAGAGAGFAGSQRRGGGRGAQGFVYFQYTDVGG